MPTILVFCTILEIIQTAFKGGQKLTKTLPAWTRTIVPRGWDTNFRASESTSEIMFEANLVIFDQGSTWTRMTLRTPFKHVYRAFKHLEVPKPVFFAAGAGNGTQLHALCGGAGG